MKAGASQIPNKSSRNILRPQIRDDKKISNKERHRARQLNERREKGPDQDRESAESI